MPWRRRSEQLVLSRHSGSVDYGAPRIVLARRVTRTEIHHLELHPGCHCFAGLYMQPAYHRQTVQLVTYAKRKQVQSSIFDDARRGIGYRANTHELFAGRLTLKALKAVENEIDTFFEGLPLNKIDRHSTLEWRS